MVDQKLLTLSNDLEFVGKIAENLGKLSQVGIAFTGEVKDQYEKAKLEVIKYVSNKITETLK